MTSENTNAGATRAVIRNLTKSTGMHSEAWEALQHGSVEDFRTDAISYLSDKSDLRTVMLESADWTAVYVHFHGSEPTEPAPAPSSWVIEAPTVSGPEWHRPVMITVSDTDALLSALRLAGLTTSVRNFPGTETASYIHADRADVSLTLRRPNADESAPAAPVPDFVRIDAEEYRYLAEQISATMDDPDPWDGDEAESFILAQYVKWLANGKPVDVDGYPDKRDDAAAGRPDVTAALAHAVSALDLAESYFDDPDTFRLSMQGVLEQVRDDLAQIRDALTGHRTADPDDAESDPFEHVHFFPLPPNAATDPTMEPGDCECGLTFAEHISNPESQTQRLPGDDRADGPADDSAAFTEALAAAFPYVPEVCKYSTAHARSGVPAVTTLDCRPVGMIPACQACADFYTRQGGAVAVAQSADPDPDDDDPIEHDNA